MAEATIGNADDSPALPVQHGHAPGYVMHHKYAGRLGPSQHQRHTASPPTDEEGEIPVFDTHADDRNRAVLGINFSPTKPTHGPVTESGASMAEADEGSDSGDAADAAPLTTDPRRDVRPPQRRGARHHPAYRSLLMDRLANMAPRPPVGCPMSGHWDGCTATGEVWCGTCQQTLCSR